MHIQLRLTILNFVQFFVWGAWLISLGGYMIVTLGMLPVCKSVEMVSG